MGGAILRKGFFPSHVRLSSVGGALKEALSIGLLGPGYSCGSSWGPLSLLTFGPSIARVWCLKASAKKSISHEEHCCCHCISWGLRGHWPMMLIGDYKTLGKAKAILKRTFLPSCDLLYLYSKRKYCLRNKGEICSSWLSQWRKRAVGRREDAFCLAYSTGA